MVEPSSRRTCQPAVTLPPSTEPIGDRAAASYRIGVIVQFTTASISCPPMVIGIFFEPETGPTALGIVSPFRSTVMLYCGDNDLVSFFVYACPSPHAFASIRVAVVSLMSTAPTAVMRSYVLRSPDILTRPCAW